MQNSIAHPEAAYLSTVLIFIAFSKNVEKEKVDRFPYVGFIDSDPYLCIV